MPTVSPDLPRQGNELGWPYFVDASADPCRQRPQQQTQREDRAEAQQEQIELPLGLRFGPVAIGGQHPAETERVAHHEGVEFVHVLAAKSEGPPYSGEPSLLLLKEIERGT